MDPDQTAPTGIFLLKLAQEKVWLGEMAVDLGRKATKQTNKNIAI